MSTLWNDLRYGLRTLAKKPAFTGVAVLALAIGIGANATIFSLLDALLLRPPVAGEPDRLVNVHAVDRDGSGFHAFSYLDTLDYRTDNDRIALAAWTASLVSLGTGDEPRVALGQMVSAGYFDVMGIEPVAGRFFAPGEDLGQDANPVAVIGHELWQRLGGTEAVLGETVRVNDRPLTVIGVAPEGFKGGFGVVASDVWVTLSMQSAIEPGIDPQNRGHVWLEMIGRPAPGISKDEAEAFLVARYGQLAEAYPNSHQQEGSVTLGDFGTVPGQMRGGVSIFMAMMMGVVTLLLLITCVNVAGMLLTRAAERRREIAVRLAIGAGRGRVVRQLVTESLLLFFLGGMAGSLVAFAAVRLFSGIQLPLPLPVALELGVDPRVLAFTLAVTLITGILFGLAPAFGSTRLDLTASLKEESGSDGPRRLRLRSALVVAQVAVALVLLVAAGLFLRSLSNAATVDPGFAPDHVHLASLDLGMHGYEDDAVRSFYADLGTRLRAIPGVESASAARMVPLGLGNSTTGFNVPGHAPPTDDSAHPADTNSVGIDYFRTVAMPVVAGRGFDRRDTADSKRVVVINRTLADRFWPGESPIGQEIELEGRNGPGSEVIGVVADAKYRTLGEQPRFFVYRPHGQDPSAQMTVHVRAQPGVPGIPAAVRRTIHELDPNLPVAGQISMREAIGLSLLPQRIAGVATGVFGVLGLLLVAIGVYGVTAVSVSQRTREMGVRVALGAGIRDVLGLVLGQGLRLGVLGVVVGLAISMAVTRLLESLLFGTSATDPLVLAATAVILIAIVLAGSMVPAWRAARVDPLTALRHG